MSTESARALQQGRIVPQAESCPVGVCSNRWVAEGAAEDWVCEGMVCNHLKGRRRSEG